MATLLISSTRHAYLRASAAYRVSLMHPLALRPLSSVTSPSAAEVIADWKVAVLKKPVIVERDTIRPQPLQQLAMTLDKTTPTAQLFKKGAPLPVNWHHAFFPPMIGEADLGQDGYDMAHAPPAPFLARMWAGGGVEQNPSNLLKIGQEMMMKTKCTGVDIKQSRSGETMVFVSLEKLIENEHGWALTDRRTLVYMEKDEKRVNTSNPKNVKPRREADFSMAVHPTAILLFRYSALTFNSHRIHFDHEYANKIEDHPERAYDSIFKVCSRNTAVVPTMDADVVESYEVWVENPEGGLAMSSTVEVVQEAKA
ncbi:hypothetical protein BGZ65_002068 [Modicella reniformis]|uniref:N-terminal of MaoC-like dehydratase domain-containing protein n=1 Tax=Modicella reniformis TaxID=1440133 RepID=A0A9P6LU26_9FUNG|nr:hypothetical protein BGZ65_002068 [Modicella reniformis]